ncbi:MAG: carboxypeptidase regulatory-like domain-containing protein [Betaproteobacteria bacterium]|jgi:hypothetical protein|nr:MAG: carboxypeptidase regulatory-like domain-containing protein [Betaproteobacteria bacterium]TMH37175.1 MAG: carboxypeptidase regulatory-like domain-containing protein [Betaproteobacteria bacterium]
MKTRSLTPWPAAAALALAGAAVLGAGLPPEQRAGGVTYVTGGVAADESAAFKQARADYPLTVQLVERAGAHNAYTANSRVKLVDTASGVVVLDAQADGPFMLVRLPSGNYRVEATLNGRTVQTKTVTVSSTGHTQVDLVFPQGTD